MSDGHLPIPPVPQMIVTHCVAPPIPFRSFDWRAYRDGTEESGPVGYGETEDAAVADLMDQLEDAA